MAPATTKAWLSNAKPYLKGTGIVTSGRPFSEEKSTLPQKSAIR